MDRSHVVRRSALACALFALPWGGAAAQDTTGTGASPRGLRTNPDTASIDVELRRLQHYRELTRVARDRIERALLQSEDDPERSRILLIDAERHARAAVELVPDSAQGFFLVGAALGLRAEHEAVRRRLRMAGEVHAAALRALEIDPDHAGAHHVVGRVHLEVMRLSGMTRLIATHLFGASMIRQASWQQAELHLRRAAELEPDMLGHRLWLGRLHLERGNEAAARRELQGVVDAAPRSDLDRLWQRQALEAVDRIR